MRRVGVIKFILVATARYIEGFSKRLTPRDLAGVDFVTFAGFKMDKDGFRLSSGEERIQAKVSSVRCQSTSTAAILEMVKGSMGVGLLPDFHCAEAIVAGLQQSNKSVTFPVGLALKILWCVSLLSFGTRVSAPPTDKLAVCQKC